MIYDVDDLCGHGGCGKMWLKRFTQGGQQQKDIHGKNYPRVKRKFYEYREYHILMLNINLPVGKLR